MRPKCGGDAPKAVPHATGCAGTACSPTVLEGVVLSSGRGGGRGG
jgi:hypothetical protein